VVDVKDVVMSVHASSMYLLTYNESGFTNPINPFSPVMNGSASLIFTSTISMTGSSLMFLPDYHVVINMGTNYSLVRVGLRATSPSLSYISNEKSYIDIIPKCSLGSYIETSKSSYDCMKCPNGSYSNQVDSKACRLVFSTVLFSMCWVPCALGIYPISYAAFARLVASQTKREMAASHVLEILTSLKSKTKFAGRVQTAFLLRSSTTLVLPSIF
jgi:hypothetical protein